MIDVRRCREAKQEMLKNMQVSSLYGVTEDPVVTKSRANKRREWRGARSGTDENSGRMTGLRGGRIACGRMLA